LETVIIQELAAAGVPTAADLGLSQSGMLRKHYWNKTDTEVVTTSTAYDNVITVSSVPMDTTKYEYIITFLTPVYRGHTGADGVDMAIYVGNTKVSEAGHRLYNNSLGIYANQEIRCKVTSGYVGSYDVSGKIASYNGYSVSTHDNHSTDTGSSVFILEFYK
jgi:hypothetical protein